MCKGIETAGYVEDIFVEGTQRQGNRRRHKQLNTQEIILLLKSNGNRYIYVNTSL